MKVLYEEGLTSHLGPESCVGSGNAAGEALTGAHMGGVLSRENRCSQGADAVVPGGRQHSRKRYGELLRDPARSETSSTCGNSMRENREAPWPPCPQPGRAGGRKR